MEIMNKFRKIYKNTNNNTKSLSIINSEIGENVKIGSSPNIVNSKITGNIKIGDHVKIIDCSIFGKVNIGRFTSLNGPNTDIHSAINKVNIGCFCSIARSVTMQEYNHIFDRCTSYYIFQNFFKEENHLKDITSDGDIYIGNDVWIGAQSVILSGTRIGNGAVIGANSTVTSEIPPYSIACGSPAKVIGRRFSQEIIDNLQEIQWWNWPDKKIRSNIDLFSGKLTVQKLNNIKHG